MERVTFIADVELYGTDEDNPSLLFGAAVVAAAQSPDITSLVKVQFFEDEDGTVRIGVTLPYTNDDTSEEAKIILDEALGWFNLKAACKEYLLITRH